LANLAQEIRQFRCLTAECQQHGDSRCPRAAQTTLTYVLIESVERRPQQEPARAYQPYLKGSDNVGVPVLKKLLGPIATRPPLFTETIPVGLTNVRVNEARLAAPVTCTP
jgi:hypothetical protein